MFSINLSMKHFSLWYLQNLNHQQPWGGVRGVASLPGNPSKHSRKLTGITK